MTRFVGIDPSTKTGFVALDENGNVLKAKELTGVGRKDPQRMATMIDEIMAHIKKDDVIVIEGFGFNSQQAIQLGGIGWGIRMGLLRRGFKYYDVSPNTDKKFVNVTGWIGEKDNKRRLVGKEKKKAVMYAVFEHYRFVHSSDNIVDAYIMAKITFSLHNKNGLLPYQLEVVDSILNPKPKAKKVAK